MIASLSLLFPNIQTEAQSRLRKIQNQLTEKLINGTKNKAIDKQLFEIVAHFIKETKRFSLIVDFGQLNITRYYLTTKFNFSPAMCPPPAKGISRACCHSLSTATSILSYYVSMYT